MVASPQSNRKYLRSPRNWRTAVHKAGHSVIAIVEGCPFEDVVLQKVDDTTAMLRSLEYRAGDEEIVRILLGGIVAARFTRSRWDYSLFQSCNSDLRKIGEFYFGHPNPERSLRYNIDRVALSLSDCWNSVEHIATDLVRRKMLSAEQIRELYQNGLDDIERRRPPGKLAKNECEPLYDHLKLRVRYPNGLTDMLNEIRQGHVELIAGANAAN